MGLDKYIPTSIHRYVSDGKFYCHKGLCTLPIYSSFLSESFFRGSSRFLTKELSSDREVWPLLLSLQLQEGRRWSSEEGGGHLPIQPDQLNQPCQSMELTDVMDRPLSHFFPTPLPLENTDP